MLPLGLISFVEGLLGPEFGKFAKPLIYGVLAVLLIAAFFGLKSCYDHGVVSKHEQQIQQRAAPATNEAAVERVNDNATNARNEEEMHNAIQAQPDQPIAPTSRALSCERLRRAGRHTAACR